MIRFANIALIVVIVVSIAAGFLLDARAGTLRDREAALRADLTESRERLRLLESEVETLERPERIERLARQYLGYQRLESDRDLSLSQAPKVLGAPDWVGGDTEIPLSPVEVLRDQ